MFRGMWIGTLFLQASRVVVSLALCVACGPFCQGKYLHNSRAMRFAEFEIRSLPMQVSGQSGPGELSLRWQWNGYMVAFCCFLLAFGLADTRYVCIYNIYTVYWRWRWRERYTVYIYIYNLFKCFLGHPMLETHQTYPKI